MGNEGEKDHWKNGKGMGGVASKKVTFAKLPKSYQN
jgi:hypothetical protein